MVVTTQLEDVFLIKTNIHSDARKALKRHLTLKLLKIIQVEKLIFVKIMLVFQEGCN